MVSPYSRQLPLPLLGGAARATDESYAAVGLDRRRKGKGHDSGDCKDQPFHVPPIAKLGFSAGHKAADL